MGRSDCKDLESTLFWELWQNSPDNMFLLRVDDGQIYIVNFNDPQLDALELTRGVPMREQIDPGLFDLVMPNYQRCIELRRAIQYEESETFSTGSLRHWNTMLCPTLDEAGDVEFIFGIAREITEQKRIQAEAQAAALEAERANRIKMAFMANLSHEMRTSLNGIQSAVDLLGDIQASPAQQELHQIISESSQVLSRLTSDILDYARIEAGQLTLMPVAFSLQEVVSEVNRLMVPRLEHKPVTLEWQWQPTDDLFHGDAGRIKQILVNLVGNAIKFTDQGRVEVAISLAKDSVKEGVQNLTCEVLDTGSGIDAEDLKLLFQPFQRLNSKVARRVEGTGLGLAICKDLVDLMHGDIWAASVVDQGSRFTFRIPLFNNSDLPPLQSDDAGLGAAAEISTTDTGLALSGTSVLLVEDNRVNQLVTRKLLERLGVKVQIAANGLEALNIYENQSFDAVLMDWHMPVMDGLEATRNIRNLTDNKRSIPVIGLTASAMEDERQTCMEAGMSDLVTKPINPTDLFNALNSLIKH